MEWRNGDLGNDDQMPKRDYTFEKNELIKALMDVNNDVTREDLNGIINKEFFDGNNAFSDDLIEAVVYRLALLDHGNADEATLQQTREEMMTEVVGRLLGMET